MLTRIVASLCFTGIAALAAGQLRPPDLKDLSKNQFQDLLSKSLSKRSRAGLAASSGSCSIPLLEPKGSKASSYPMPRLPAGQTLDRIAAPTPAPTCKNW